MTTEQRDELADGGSAASEAYRREARELGVPWDRASRRINVVDELAQLSYVKADPDRILGPILVANWRQLSGYQHGLMWAILRGSTRSLETRIPGGIIARLTVDDGSINSALQTAGLMLIWAVDTYLRRCRQPSSPVRRTI